MPSGAGSFCARLTTGEHRAPGRKLLHHDLAQHGQMVRPAAAHARAQRGGQVRIRRPEPAGEEPHRHVRSGRPGRRHRHLAALLLQCRLAGAGDVQEYLHGKNKWTYPHYLIILSALSSPLSLAAFSGDEEVGIRLQRSTAPVAVALCLCRRPWEEGPAYESRAVQRHARYS